MTHTSETSPAQQQAFLVGLQLPASERKGWSAEESVEELARLVDTAGASVVGQAYQGRQKPDRATFIGKGKAEEIEAQRRYLGADLVVFDGELSPIQQRNLEEIIECQITDRTTVILDIFAQRARTREAKLQVELAQQNYRLPRLTGKGVELSRLGGGIGTRGPGETKLEVDRRRIRERISALRGELAEIQAHRTRLRSDRSQGAMPVVALTGYTNAGKSTLHRALAGSDVLAEDRLFVTLDATTRRVESAEGEPYLLVDTVGFIHNLPTFLVAAFRSTLEEVTQADLLLHVVDASHPKWEEQMATVHHVLSQLKADAKPTVVVFNKADRVAAGELEHLVRITPNAISVSAGLGQNLDDLQRAIFEALSSRRDLFEAVIPYSQTSWVAWIHERGRVIVTEHRNDGIYLKAELEKGLAARVVASLRAAAAH